MSGGKLLSVKRECVFSPHISILKYFGGSWDYICLGLGMESFGNPELGLNHINMIILNIFKSFLFQFFTNYVIKI